MIALVLAAGLGRRFGQEKQLTAVDDKGHCLLDYTLYDAHLCGVDEVVLVIRAEAEDLVRATLVARLASHVRVRYACQTSPTMYGFEAGHPPLGTGHAFLCGAQDIRGAFIVCNADDFYGRASIGQAVKCAEEGRFGCVVYPAGQTVGRDAVHRGICLCDEGRLTGICECTFGRDARGRLYAADATCRKYVREGVPVSMNLYAMGPAITATAAQCFARFLEEGQAEECYLGDVVTAFAARPHTDIRVLRARDRWMGMTYMSDLNAVRARLDELVREGTYPRDLWGSL